MARNINRPGVPVTEIYNVEKDCGLKRDAAGWSPEDQRAIQAHLRSGETGQKKEGYRQSAQSRIRLPS